MSIGPFEIAIILVLVVLLFGAKRLPEFGRSLGSGLREFKDGVTLAKEPATLAKEPFEAAKLSLSRRSHPAAASPAGSKTGPPSSGGG